MPCVFDIVGDGVDLVTSVWREAVERRIAVPMRDVFFAGEVFFVCHDIFPYFWSGAGDLIRPCADEWSVLLVKRFDPVWIAALGKLEGIWDAGDAAEKWSWDL